MTNPARRCPPACLPPSGCGAGGEGGGEGEDLDAETALDLLNLGIVSPVTRETAGSLYLQELSRQVRCASPLTSSLLS